MDVGYLLTGGFLKGYRTYALAALGVAVAVTHWAVGDATTSDTMNSVWQIVLSLSVGTARAAIK